MIKVNVLKSALLGFAISGLTACGTTYSPPNEKAPAIWQGKHGVKTTGTTVKTIPGNHAIHSHFAEINAKNVRTARLLEDVSYNSGAGITELNKAAIIKAGSPLYARQYTHSVTTTYGYGNSHTSTQDNSNNPIEWCTPAPSGKGAVCIFWRSKDKAFYLEDKKSSPLSPSFRYSTVGDNGPMPKIIEDQTIHFSQQLKHALQITNISKKGVSVSHILGTETDDKFIGASVRKSGWSKWDDQDSAELSIWNGRFKFTAVRNEKGKPISAKVEVLKQPNWSAYNNLSKQELKLLSSILQSAILAAAKEKEQATK